MAYDLERLSPEQRDQLAGLLSEAEVEETGGRGVAPDDPDRAWGEAPKPNPAVVTRLKTPADWVNKQIGNLTAVGDTNYRAGITAPKKDPIAAGIAAQAKYEAKMRDPEVLKRRESQLRKSNIDIWASMAERLGAPRLVQGVTERRFKVEDFVGRYQPKLLEHVRKIDALPDVTDADRERRMLDNLRGLRALKGKV